MSDGRELFPPESFRKVLELELPGWGLTPPGPAVARLAALLAELDRWRSRMNLTGRLSAPELATHALESVLGERFLPAGARVVDIGTGGGFPGVPLAIWRPDLEMTWLEPREKRAAFLRHVRRMAPIQNARVLRARAEDLENESFDCATSRAVRVEGVLAGKLAFLAPGGALVLWTVTPERLAPELLSAGLRYEDEIAIPGSRDRSIGLFRKG